MLIVTLKLLASDSISFFDTPFTFFNKCFLTMVFLNGLFCLLLQYVQLFSNENNKARICREIVKYNLHLVDALYQNIQDLLDYWVFCLALT